MRVQEDSNYGHNLVSWDKDRKSWGKSVRKYHVDFAPFADAVDLADGREPMVDTSSGIGQIVEAAKPFGSEIGRTSAAASSPESGPMVSMLHEDYDATFDEALDCLVIDVGMGRGTSCGNCVEGTPSLGLMDARSAHMQDWITSLLPRMSWISNICQVDKARIGSCEKLDVSGDRFEKFMDDVAFPERHVSCDANSNQRSIDQVMDFVAFPENHLSCERNVVQETRMGYSEGIHGIVKEETMMDKKKRLTKQSIPARNHDFLDQVFEDVEEQYCDGSSTLVSSMLQSKGDLLEYACNDVDNILCRNDSNLTENHTSNATASTDCSAPLTSGDVIMVQNLSSRRSDDIKKTNAVHERETGDTTINGFTSNKNVDIQYGMHICRSNRSLISDSSSVSTLSSKPHIEMKVRNRFSAQNDDMELVLASIDSKGRRKKNFIQRFLPCKSSYEI